MTIRTIFLAIFVCTLPAEFIANDKPLVVWFDGGAYFPVVVSYPETVFGGDFETEADYRDPFVKELIEAKGWKGPADVLTGYANLEKLVGCHEE